MNYFGGAITRFGMASASFCMVMTQLHGSELIVAQSINAASGVTPE
jgi:hypothetical protein